MIDVSALLEEIKASPYEEISITTPHTGVVRFPEGLAPGARVHGPSGTWKEKPGTTLATIEREKNVKPIRAPQKSEVTHLATELEGSFVQAGETVATLRHFLSKDEVIEILLKQALSLFPAPERAAYYFAPEVDTKISASGHKSVTVAEGMDLFIMSRMKRETALTYSGPEGAIYAVYFAPGENVDAGAPLIGVCPEELMPLVEDVVIRVQTEWVEGE